MVLPNVALTSREEAQRIPGQYAAALFESSYLVRNSFSTRCWRRATVQSIAIIQMIETPAHTHADSPGDNSGARKTSTMKAWYGILSRLSHSSGVCIDCNVISFLRSNVNTHACAAAYSVAWFVGSPLVSGLASPANSVECPLTFPMECER